MEIKLNYFTFHYLICTNDEKQSCKKLPANFGTVQHGQKQEVFALGSHGFGWKNWRYFFAFFFFF